MRDCPSQKHFHVAFVDTMENRDFNFVFEVGDPNDALSQAIKDLPDNWESSIEVNDHITQAPGQLPLIDYWRTPIKKI